MITADQILAHLIGDYILQSDWMANEKTKRSFAAAVHALCYSLPFLAFQPSLAAFAFIAVTHFIIDRWRLARYVVWAKNWIAPYRVRYVMPSQSDDPLAKFTSVRTNLFQVAVRDTPHVRPWAECAATGYSPDRPIWLTTWLLIIADNTLHLLCNGIALRWF